MHSLCLLALEVWGGYYDPNLNYIPSKGGEYLSATLHFGECRKLKTYPTKKLAPTAASNLQSTDRMSVSTRSQGKEKDAFMEPSVENENDTLQQEGNIARDERGKKSPVHGREHPCNIQPTGNEKNNHDGS